MVGHLLGMSLPFSGYPTGTVVSQPGGASGKKAYSHVHLSVRARFIKCDVVPIECRVGGYPSVHERSAIGRYP